jgi:amino acid permease
MAKIEKQREFINYFKIFVALGLATTLAITGWLVRNFTKIDFLLNLISIITILILIITVIFLNNKIIKKINKLEEL